MNIILLRYSRFSCLFSLFFTLVNIQASGQVPVNDNCSNAISLVAGTSCIIGTYSNENATTETASVAPDPDCRNYGGGDVWFTVVMPASGALRIESKTIGYSIPPSVSVYTGICGSFAELICYQVDADKTIFDPALGGQTLYIRVFSYNSAVGHPFTLCLFEPAIPPNDNCANALELPVGTSCQAVAYTNQYATKEPFNVALDPDCRYYAGGDVWFKAVMPASGALRIEARNLDVATPPAMSVYSGTCGAFTEVTCYFNDPDKTVNAASLAGQTLYIRVYSFNSEEGHPFSICVFEPSIPPNDNCVNAITLPIGTSCQNNSYTNAYSTKEAVTIAPDPDCRYYNGGDIWFKAVMPSSGALRIEAKNLDIATPPSVSVYSGTCGNFNEITCYFQDADKTIREPALAGQTLYIRVYSFNTEEGHPFSICVFEPSVPLNDDCANAIALPVGTSCQPTGYSNEYATRESVLVAVDPDCRYYAGGDVWFKATMPPSGVVTAELKNLSGATAPSLTIYSGTCGSFQEKACFNLSTKPIVIDQALGGQAIYLRVYSFNSEEGSPFSICLYDPGCIPVSVQQTYSICEGESFTFGGQFLTEEGSYSHTFQTMNGCDSLVNLMLTVNPTYYDQDTVTVCHGASYQFPDGSVTVDIQTAFDHTSNLQSIHHCDSIIETHVEIYQVNTSVMQNNITMTAEIPLAIYQWLDCNNNYAPLPGETSQEFTATVNGNYAVMITDNSCADTSACYQVVVLDISDIEPAKAFKVFPNPAQEEITLRFEDNTELAYVELINTFGQIMVVHRLEDASNFIFDLQGIPSGAYFIRVTTRNDTRMIRQVKIR